jgi:caffeoyl-CoA O-methyltransferase
VKIRPHWPWGEFASRPVVFEPSRPIPAREDGSNRLFAAEHHIANDRARVVLDRLRTEDQAQRDAGLPQGRRTRNITAPTGALLYSLVRAAQPRLIVEIGSSNGYSTIWLGLAARAYGGRVVGSEIIPERAEEANRNLRDAGLSDVASVRAGDGSQIAEEFGTIDLVFLDAEKDDYSRHFLTVAGRVRPGGVVLTDNVTSHDCSDLLRLIGTRSDMVTQTLPFERGIEFTLKR